MKLILMPYRKEIPVNIDEFSLKNGKLYFSGWVDEAARFSLQRIQQEGSGQVSELELQIGRWLTKDDVIGELGTEGAADVLGCEWTDILGYLMHRNEK